MASFRIPADEISRRISTFQKYLRTQKLTAALLVQRIDLLYFSGTAQSGCLYIPARGEPDLFVKRYLPRAAAESPGLPIFPGQRLGDRGGVSLRGRA